MAAEWPGASSPQDADSACLGGSSGVAGDGCDGPGPSDNRAGSRSPFATAPKPQWIDPGQLARLVTTTDQPYESQGHDPPRYQIRIEVSPEAAELYRTLQPGSSFPKGTWLVARHTKRPVSGRIAHQTAEHGPIYYMYKGNRGWSYGAATAEGHNIPVVEGVCQDCHTQARADSVFGLPSPNP